MGRFLALVSLLAACDKPAEPTETPPPEPDAPAMTIEEPDPAAFEIDADAPGNGAECSDRTTYANIAIKRARDEAAKGCKRNEDCVLVSFSTGCQGGCQEAVNAMYQDKYESLRSALDQKVCKGFQKKDKCPYATPRCVEGTAICDFGTCTFEMGAVSY